MVVTTRWGNNYERRCRSEAMLEDARRKLAMFLLDVLGGFTQRRITQALPKIKNNASLNT
jgi:hypothetical protein